MRPISNSEVAAYQKCEMKHYFQFILHLKPKFMPDGLFMGSAGHEGLAAFYQALMEGDPIPIAELKMNVVIDDMITDLVMAHSTGRIDTVKLGDYSSMLGRVKLLLKDYVRERASKDKWKILAVEKKYETGEGYVLRLDLLVETEGGKIVVVDHKFLSQFMEINQLKMNAQIPKYIGVLDKEVEIDYGVINQFCTNASATTKFMRDQIPYDRDVYERRITEQNMVAERIRPLYEVEKSEAKRRAVRSVDFYSSCRTCEFFLPCIMDLRGDDNELVLMNDYVESDYGYGP